MHKPISIRLLGEPDYLQALFVSEDACHVQDSWITETDRSLWRLLYCHRYRATTSTWRTNNTMYTSIRRYNIKPDSTEEVIRRSEKGFLPIVTKSPGFLAYDLVNT